jgi:uridylate kinase
MVLPNYLLHGLDALNGLLDKDPKDLADAHEYEHVYEHDNITHEYVC